MNFTRDDKQVIQAFMEQKEMKSFKCKSDGQSFYSGELRIAEHYPHSDGTASTLLYDFTERGGKFVDRHTQWHYIIVAITDCAFNSAISHIK